MAASLRYGWRDGSPVSPAEGGVQTVDGAPVAGASVAFTVSYDKTVLAAQLTNGGEEDTVVITTNSEGIATLDEFTIDNKRYSASAYHGIGPVNVFASYTDPAGVAHEVTFLLRVIANPPTP